MSADNPPPTDADIEKMNARALKRFATSARNPALWRYTAHGQLFSAKILFDALKASYELMFRDREPDEPAPPGYYTLPSCILLAGFAVENLCKALAVKRGLIEVNDSGMRLPKAFKHHDPLEMINELSVTVNDRETKYLSTTGLLLNSVARYPVGKTPKTHRIERRLDGSIGSNTAQTSMHIETLFSVAKKLDELIDPRHFLFDWADHPPEA